MAEKGSTLAFTDIVTKGFRDRKGAAVHSITEPSLIYTKCF